MHWQSLELRIYHVLRVFDKHPLATRILHIAFNFALILVIRSKSASESAPSMVSTRFDHSVHPPDMQLSPALVLCSRSPGTLSPATRSRPAPLGPLSPSRHPPLTVIFLSPATIYLCVSWVFASTNYKPTVDSDFEHVSKEGDCDVRQKSAMVLVTTVDVAFQF